MTNAVSEPDSIVPMAIDTSQWKVDLHDLHSSGLRLDFASPVFDDQEENPAARPRTGRRVLGVMTAMLLVAGLGFAAFRGRPALQRAYASTSASWRAARTTVQAPPPAAAPAPMARTPVTQVTPIPVTQTPVAQTPVAPAQVVPAQVVPTFDANALPNAPKAKRAPAKSRGTRAKSH